MNSLLSAVVMPPAILCTFVCAVHAQPLNDEQKPATRETPAATKSFRDLLHPGQWVTWDGDQLRIYSKIQMDRAVKRHEAYRKKLITINELFKSPDVTSDIKKFKEVTNPPELPKDAVPHEAFFEVFEIGRDYVGLRQSNTERFVQLAFIRGIVRRRPDETSNSQVPIEFELDRDRHELKRLEPEIRRTMYNIAKEEVAIERLETEIKHDEAALQKSARDIATLKKALDRGDEKFEFAGRQYTAEQVKKDLNRRIENHQTNEILLETLRSVGESRTHALKVARSRLENHVKTKNRLEKAVADLGKEMGSTKGSGIDESLERTRELVGEIKKKLEIE